MKEKLVEFFKAHNGFLTSDKLRESSMRYHLNKMIESGDVVKLRHGFYIHNEYLSCDERLLVANMIPGGVFFLFSAWQIHELSTTVPHQYHLAIQRTTKISSTSYPPVVLHYLSPKVYSLGITECLINEQKIKCYNLERSVCDAVKFRNKTGEDIMQEVIKNYMRRNNKNLNLLMQYAGKLRIEKIMMPYIKALL